MDEIYVIVGTTADNSKKFYFGFAKQANEIVPIWTTDFRKSDMLYSLQAVRDVLNGSEFQNKYSKTLKELSKLVDNNKFMIIIDKINLVHIEAKYYYM